MASLPAEVPDPPPAVATQQSTGRSKTVRSSYYRILINYYYYRLLCLQRRSPKKRLMTKKGGRKIQQALQFGNQTSHSVSPASSAGDDDSSGAVSFILPPESQTTLRHGVTQIRRPREAAEDWEQKETGLRHDVIPDFEHCFVSLHFLNYFRTCGKQYFVSSTFLASTAAYSVDHVYSLSACSWF